METPYDVAGAGTSDGLMPRRRAVPDRATVVLRMKPGAVRSRRYQRVGLQRARVRESWRVECQGTRRWRYVSQSYYFLSNCVCIFIFSGRRKERYELTIAKAIPQNAPKVLTRSFQTGAHPLLPVLVLNLRFEGGGALYSALTGSSSSSCAFHTLSTYGMSQPSVIPVMPQKAR